MAQLLTKIQVAELLAVTTRTVERMMHDKQIPYVRLRGNVVRFRESDLDAMIDRKLVNKKAAEAIRRPL